MRAPTAFFAIAAACFLCSHARAGCTHYFTWHEAADEASLRSCIAELSRVVAARKQPLLGPHQPGLPPGSPVVVPLSVDLNGLDDGEHAQGRTSGRIRAQTAGRQRVGEKESAAVVIFST